MYTLVPGVLPVLLVKVPPAPPSLHTAEVALPLNEPPSAGVDPPWQIAVNAEPTPTTGDCTVMLVADVLTVPQPEPLVTEQ
jgi:hypothetical protein